jgi:hypothetical protein
VHVYAPAPHRSRRPERARWPIPSGGSSRCTAPTPNGAYILCPDRAR